MISLYSYIHQHLDPSGCNSCSFTATYTPDGTRVTIYASICGDGKLDVRACDEHGDEVWVKEIDIFCQPEDCPFSEQGGVECFN